MRKYLTIVLVLSLLLVVSCHEKYVPKPRGYFRISFLKKSYHRLDSIGLPYRFDIPDYSKVVPDRDRQTEPYWVNLEIPNHQAEVHISYKKIRNNLAELIDDSYKLAYKHTVKADAINEKIFTNPKQKVYGTIYEIEGNAASPLQFFLTDSTRNFLRGALYIREIPNIDSLRPVIDYLTPDVMRLIETTEWKR
jgi:gliding motility-associated lipoprotein GldD